MRISSYAVARPMYWDRAPSQVSIGYYNTIAPAAYTTRWTYTVPAGRKAFIDSGSINVNRVTVAAPVGVARATIETPASSIILAVFATSNIAGDIQRASVGGSLLILAGTAIVGTTEDTSTGGTMLFAMFAHGVEFDA